MYFTHKGTEKLFEGRRPRTGVALAERVSGDTSVGHALAFCQAIEALAGTDGAAAGARTSGSCCSSSSASTTTSADFGMIVSDTGFAFAHAHCCGSASGCSG